MKRLYCLLTFFFAFLFCSAQSTLSEADRLFNDGQYEKAKLIYVRYADQSLALKMKYKDCTYCSSYFKMAEKSFHKGEFQTAVKICNVILEKNPQDPITLSLREKAQSGLQTLRKKRDDALEKARVEHSIDQVLAFKDTYKKQKEQLAKADSIMKDIPLWEKALNTNTKQSYQNYLSSTPYNRYKNEAKYIVRRFECEETWKRIEDSRIINDFESYLTDYDVYDLHEDEAQARITLLQGIELCDENRYVEAYDLLNKAYMSNKVPFLKSDKKAYELSKDYYTYNKASSISELETYLEKFKNGENRDNASSRISCLKADQLTEFSSRATRNDIRSMAKTKESQEYVDHVFKDLKRLRIARRTRTYGPVLTFGVGGSFEINEHVNSWSVNAWLRCGRICDWVNLTIGAGYRAYNAMELSSEYEDGTHYLGAQVIAPVDLRFNLIPLGDKAKIFIGAGVEFGFSVGTTEFLVPDGEYGSYYPFDDSVLEKNTISFYPMLGVTSRHVEFGLYYKRFGDNLFKHEILFPTEIIGTKELYGIKLNCYF